MSYLPRGSVILDVTPWEPKHLVGDIVVTSTNGTFKAHTSVTALKDLEPTERVTVMLVDSILTMLIEGEL